MLPMPAWPDGWTVLLAMGLPEKRPFATAAAWLCRLVQARVDCGFRSRETLLNILLRAADGHGELFERTAARLFEHARIVAARLLCLAFGKPDAVVHRLRHAHRLGRSFFEELFEMGFFK